MCGRGPFLLVGYPLGGPHPSPNSGILGSHRCDFGRIDDNDGMKVWKQIFHPHTYFLKPKEMSHHFLDIEINSVPRRH